MALVEPVNFTIINRETFFHWLKICEENNLRSCLLWGKIIIFFGKIIKKKFCHPFTSPVATSVKK